MAGINPLSNYIYSLILGVLITSYLYLNVTMGGLGTGVHGTAPFMTFKHGFFHGFVLGTFVIVPAFVTNALFEHKSIKYIVVLSGYWIINAGIMGGVVNSCSQI